MNPLDRAVLELATPSLLRVFLVGLRLVPGLVLLPFLGGRALPAPLRLVLAFLLAAGLLPATASTTAGATPDGWLLVAGLRELSLGLVLALVLAAPFLALEQAGRLLDTARGTRTDGSSSALVEILRCTGVLVFLGAGGHRGVLRVVAASIVAFPPDPAPHAPWRLAVLAQAAARWTGEALAASLVVASSGLLALVATELVLGLATRFSPPLAQSGIALPARALAPLAALALGAGLWSGVAQDLAWRALSAARLQ